MSVLAVKKVPKRNSATYNLADLNEYSPKHRIRYITPRQSGNEFAMDAVLNFNKVVDV